MKFKLYDRRYVEMLEVERARLLRENESLIAAAFRAHQMPNPLAPPTKPATITRRKSAAQLVREMQDRENKTN